VKPLPPPNAIVLENVVKSFKKTSRRKEFTTIKSELVRLVSLKRQPKEPTHHIPALTGVDLVIPRGKTVAIVGRNGSGKSTLLKLITGIYSATSGRLEVNGRISALLELGAGFHPDFTGRENILINGIILGMSRAELKDRIDAIIEFAELGDFIDEPVRTYSSGMFMRLAFAVATHVDPDILIIDEILSVGDEHFQRKSQEKMNEFRRSGRTIVLVTHSLNTVESWCDTAVWIDGGKVRMYGEPRDIISEYRRAIAAAEAEAQKTGHSALSTPGLALPGSNQVTTPDVSGVKLTGVRLRSGAGEPPEVFSPAAALQVLLDWKAPARIAVDVSVDVLSGDGRLVFSASHSAGELQGAGTLQLALPRLGLGEGTYEVVAAVKAKGLPPGPPTRVGLKVSPDATATGLIRPELSWSRTDE
jgi:lipopolysaccharide transport system ATP-binding protein